MSIFPCLCMRSTPTNDIKFTALRPGLAVHGPVSGPETAAVRHGVEISNEQTTVVGLLGGQTNAAKQLG